MHASDGRVFYPASLSKLLGRDITIYDDRLQTRPICYMDNLIGALIRRQRD